MSSLKVRCDFDYVASSEWELNLQEGAIVEVVGQFEDGWWSGKLNGKIGLFPRNYCTALNEEDKSAVDETRAASSIKRMQAQLGSVSQSGKKVADLSSEVEALKAEINAFKTMAEQKKQQPKPPADNMTVDQLKKALSGETQKRRELENRYKHDMQKLYDRYKAAEAAKKQLDEKLKELKEKPKEQLDASPDSFASPQPSPVVPRAEGEAEGEAPMSPKEDELTMIKQQLKFTLDAYDNLQMDKADMEDSYKLKLQKLLSLLEKERRAKLELPPVPTERKPSWFSQLIESKDDKVKKKTEKDKKFVELHKKCEKMEKVLEDVQGANESLLNMNRVLVVQLREVMAIRTMASPGGLGASTFFSPQSRLGASSMFFSPTSLASSSNLMASMSMLSPLGHSSAIPASGSRLPMDFLASSVVLSPAEAPRRAAPSPNRAMLLKKPSAMLQSLSPHPLRTASTGNLKPETEVDKQQPQRSNSAGSILAQKDGQGNTVRITKAKGPTASPQLKSTVKFSSPLMQSEKSRSPALASRKMDSPTLKSLSATTRVATSKSMFIASSDNAARPSQLKAGASSLHLKFEKTNSPQLKQARVSSSPRLNGTSTTSLQASNDRGLLESKTADAVITEEVKGTAPPPSTTEAAMRPTDMVLSPPVARKEDVFSRLASPKLTGTPTRSPMLGKSPSVSFIVSSKTAVGSPKLRPRTTVFGQAATGSEDEEMKALERREALKSNRRATKLPRNFLASELEKEKWKNFEQLVSA